MKIHPGKLAVFLGSTLIILYGVSAAFYGKLVAKDDAFKEIAVFMDALGKIGSDYVEVPEMTKVQEGAFRGMIEALDPYSTYLSKAQVQAIEGRKSGEADAGLTLSKRADVLYVVSTTRGGPSDAAGVRPGDYLIGVNGAGVEDKSIIEVESLLRGQPESKVKLSVFRGARTKPVDIEVTRKMVLSAAVETQILSGVGVLDVSTLAGDALQQAKVKLRTLLSAGAQKLVLDLRDCSAGKAEAGADLANLFLNDGVLYYSQNANGDKIAEVRADATKFVTDVPMVVIIGSSTAGAAEITAGALKDHRRATVIGEQSFGSGSLQTRLQMKGGAMLILSTAKHFTPSGKKIQEDDSVRTTGIKPEIQVPNDEHHRDLLVESYFDQKEDDQKYRDLQQKIAKEQLNKALELLAKAELPRKAA